MKRLLIALGILGIVLASAGNAYAVLIVDTGTPTTTDDWGWTLSNDWWVAAEFDLNQDYTLTDIQGYMWGNQSNPIITIALYTDGGEIPGTELYNADFNVEDETGWQGLSGLNWGLSASTYWVGFEVRSGDYWASAMPSLPPNPLGNEAGRGTAGSYFGSDGRDIGVRIQGESSDNPIPEPATMLLLGSGLLGLAGLNRKKRKRS